MSRVLPPRKHMGFFIMNYEKIYNQIVERGKSRTLKGYKEKHHIIPKCIGGNDDKSNLVELTAKEHFICHKLLTEIHPRESKLHYASWAMINQQNNVNHKRDYRVSSRLYERLKINISTIIKKHNTGRVHSDETKKKMSDAAKARPAVTNETRVKLSEIMKTQKKHICSRCGKEGNAGNIAYYHNENCKFS